MREETPFKFDLTGLLQQARRAFARHVDGVSVTLSLPFLSFTATPTDIERRIAREVIIRMSDRRVLSAKECCDTCIDQVLESFQSIRSDLVDKQVQLAHLTEGPLHVILEAMLEGIRQFLTFEQWLSTQREDTDYGGHCDLHRSYDQPELYFQTLEVLRGHLSRCLRQVAMIADVELPSIGMITTHRGAWPLDAYTKP